MPLEEGYDPAVAHEGVIAVLQLVQYLYKPVHNILPSPGSYAMGHRVSDPFHVIELSFLYLHSARF